MRCHGGIARELGKNAPRIALVGNANVGKSTLFNHLTGLSQHVANWPGKTVEVAKGALLHNGKEIGVVDLPGVYSLSPYTPEESVARDYLINERPFIINVIDSTALERNLYLTLQLCEMGLPFVIALNQWDAAEKKGIEIDEKKLSSILGVPVVKVVATWGKGVQETVEKALEIRNAPKAPAYGKEAEKSAARIMKELRTSRWEAFRLLQGEARAKGAGAGKIAAERKALEKMHGHGIETIVSAERYAAVSEIIGKVAKAKHKKGVSLMERMDELATHGILGYAMLFAALAIVFQIVFAGGGWISEWMGEGFETYVHPLFDAVSAAAVFPYSETIFTSAYTALMVSSQIVLAYILIFYIMLALLEDSGYITRVSYLTDLLMQRIGLNGRAFIPMLLGYGCTVPTVLSTRLLGTEKERFMVSLLSTFLPCAARAAVIFGLVGAFFGPQVALAVYAFDLVLVFFVGRVMNSILPMPNIGMIMEMPSFKVPSLRSIAVKSYARVMGFVAFALPIIIVSSIILDVLNEAGMLTGIKEIFTPIVALFGLPSIVIIPLILGILRKELALIMLAQFAGTTDFAALFTPKQMIVYSIITMVYIPCIATIAALVKESGWKRTAAITGINLLTALVIGIVANYVLSFFLV